MTELEKIIERFERGYTATLYGTVDLANFQKEYDFMELIQIVKKLTIPVVVKSLKDKYTNEFWFWLERFESEDDSNRLWWYKKDVMLSTEEMWQEYNRLKTTL